MRINAFCFVEALTHFHMWRGSMQRQSALVVSDEVVKMVSKVSRHNYLHHDHLAFIACTLSIRKKLQSYLNTG
jgi:hypothetical protein